MTAGDDPLLAAAESVHAALSAAGIPAAVIGAIALAARGFPRATMDLDLATFVSPYPSLTAIERSLKARGLDVEFRDPEPGDPLGGVLRWAVDEERRVDVVNFLNPWSGGPVVVKEAIESAEGGLVAGSAMRVARIPHLVAIKLYGGRPKDRVDVGELLSRRPEMIPETRVLCARFGYDEALEKVLAEWGIG